MHMGGTAAVVGFVLHLMFSATFGVLFAALIPREMRGGVAAALGGVVGLGIFAGMTFIVLRWTNPFMYEHVHRGMFLIAHVVYGVCLGLVVPFRRATAPRRALDTAHPRPV
jgi:hypothetical protein